ncbi:arylsulfatase [uncultured Umboniibacter sp.]|uniref:arylsulfatase n=1 Tax=uncultured Umboniibacter sp. TaxID=1798917 RepID=UPI00260A0683|nr:arylsulfatase [uncultured Umboniibacter sp.]
MITVTRLKQLYCLAVLSCLLPLSVFALDDQSRTPSSSSAAPNILLVVLDDAGFMDFGAYGSDTLTPNIDTLGQAGTMFTRYYTYPLCAPSRAALLTGQDNHDVGIGTLTEALTDDMRQAPAYSMTWQDSQPTIATRLKSAGYQTFITGKWGIGDIGVNLPHRFGFDRSFVLDATGASNYESKSYLPLNTEAKWFEDGERITTLPEDFYSSKDIVDKMIGYLNDANSDQPFFSYLSFQALHIPVQVPKEYRDKYDGVFDRGWDAMREERFHRAIELGLVADTARLAEPTYNQRPWDSLSEEEQSWWARSMQVNAGMMEAADFHLGRLLSHLETIGKLENTIVIVTSDNGPEYNTIGQTSPPFLRLFETAWMAYEGWYLDYETLGEPGSMGAIGHEWASVSAAPFHLFKFSAAEGGVRVPMVISGPSIENRGFVNSMAHVADITPTILDLAGLPLEHDEFAGRSLKPLLHGETDQVYGEDEGFAIEVSGNAALYRGNWKITRTLPPFGDGEWALYDVASDPGETINVANQYPVLFQDMLAEFELYQDDVGVYQLAPGETARSQITMNATFAIIANYWYLILALNLVIMLGVYGLYRGLKFLIRSRMGSTKRPI